jgi:predicted phosphodiesterase
MEHKVLVIPDAHLPFHNRKALAKVIKFAKEFKPTHIVQLGDLYDQYSFSKFRRTLELVVPSEEIIEANKLAVKMWKDLQKAAPKAKCYQMLGNHDTRLMKKVLERVPELESLLIDKIADLYTFDKVHTIHDDREVLELNGVLYTHGYMCGAGKHLKAFMQSTVVGHAHRGHTVFENHRGKILFELNAGHLVDVKALPLCYTPTKISNSTLGFGTVVNGVPQFIPLD